MLYSTVTFTEGFWGRLQGTLEKFSIESTLHNEFLTMEQFLF